ncbi:MAG TPA: dethiobiotin synthase [Xanthobacteraceae bacterium]|jgi:dethiobiotin synthetase
MRAVFITGTGTDIGKTFLTTALIRYLRSEGTTVRAIKPVVTGFDVKSWQDSDPAALLAALEAPVSLQEIDGISPWRFMAPLSPDIAARQEGRTIAFAHVVEFCRKALSAKPDVVLIEGIGGIMVPLDEHRTVLDLMSVLRLPLVLVAGSYVGTLSHTLTSLEVLARRNLDVAGVVVSESPTSAASLDETVATLQRFADVIEVIGLPRLGPDVLDHPALGRIAALI